MIRRLAQLIVCALLVGTAGLAAADDTPETPPAQPAVPTTLGGRITDVTGKPVANARVYIMPRGGARLQTQTDKDGRYAIQLVDAGAYSVVIAVSRVNTCDDGASMPTPKPDSSVASSSTSWFVTDDSAPVEVVLVVERTSGADVRVS